MAYNHFEWRRRLAERTDMSTFVTHLTRENSTQNVNDVLYQIIKDKTLVASTTSSGFITGEHGAVCFQDIPLTSICQNVFYEQKKQESFSYYKLRYRALGIMFSKPYIFNKGGRPVIYDKTEEAKQYLPKDQWWRIVNLNLSDNDKIVDWTHEREWRVKNNLSFELSEVTLLTIGLSSINYLCSKYKSEFGCELLPQLKGVVNLETVLY